MICTACNKISNTSEQEDCFEIAMDVLRKHYFYYKNALQQRDLEIQQIKERNEKLSKALQLLQKSHKPNKRFKPQHSSDTWVGHNTSEDDRIASDLSLTDDKPMGATYLNVALNSEQLFDTSALSETKNDLSMASSSEIIQSSGYKESLKREQHGVTRNMEACNDKVLGRSKSEWHTKGRNSPVDKYWATKFLQPSISMISEDRLCAERRKNVDKKLCLSLKKANPSRVKQTLINFDKSKETLCREIEATEDVVHGSPVIRRTSKAGYSRAQRSGNKTNETCKNHDSDKSIKNIVFDFSPSKKSDLSPNPLKATEAKELKFGDISKDSVSLPNDNSDELVNKSDSSSVVILTPATQDIIFLDDTCNSEPEIHTIDLMADIMKLSNTDNLEKLKKIESACIKNLEKDKETDLFKKPLNKPQNNVDTKLIDIKQEKISQENPQQEDHKNEVKYEWRQSCSKVISRHKIGKAQNPLFSSCQEDIEDDDDPMPKPFIVKQELKSSKSTKKISIKQRFNIDCEDCEKLINFLDDRLTDAQIQQHLDKCKRHNNPNINQNTPKDFWNPFILSFQADDPRNEILIDDRFKNKQ